MGHGGWRPNSGRPRGSKNKKTRKNIDEAAAAGQSPVEYLLEVMRDPTNEPHRRDQAARDVAPYVHPRLAMLTPRNDLSPGSDLFVTTINIVPVPAGHDANGQPFNFASNRPKLVRPQVVDVEIEVIDEPEDTEPKGPSSAA
jgi:hypothetical protein